MKRKPDEKKEQEHPTQESSWEAKRLADKQTHLSWPPLGHTCTMM